MANFDFIVLGLGGVGSATLYQLAQQGHTCVGIEQFGAVHDRGSSHGQTRIIRKAYFEHPNYVPLLQRAYELWAAIETETRQTLFHRVGLAQFGPADGEIIRGIEASADTHGLAVRRPSHDEFRREHPAFSVPEEMVILVEEDAGLLLVEPCVEQQLALAKRHGAVTHFQSPVREIRQTTGGVDVVTDGATFSAARLIITAGPWACRLLGLPIPLRVVRKHLHWYDAGAHLSAPDTPSFFFHMPNGYFYGTPAVDGGGVKVAEHSGGELLTDPSIPSRGEDPLDRRRVDEFVNKVVDVDLTHQHHDTCLYTMSPDEHFIVDRHPQHSQISFAAGLSGHGFKFTPVIAEMLIQLSINGHTQLPGEFLSLQRFTES